MEFEKGYLFGKQLGTGKYILVACEPNEDTEYGVFKYKYGNADYLYITYEELDNIEDGDLQWINHPHMLTTDAESYIGETIGDAIYGYMDKTGDEPELYVYTAPSGGLLRGIASPELTTISNMTVEDLNEKVSISDMTLYEFNAEEHALTNVCDCETDSEE